MIEYNIICYFNTNNFKCLIEYNPLNHVETLVKSSLKHRLSRLKYNVIILNLHYHVKSSKDIRRQCCATNDRNSKITCVDYKNSSVAYCCTDITSGNE